MAYVNHINLPDSSNYIYCRKRNKVVDFTDQHQSEYCNTCSMFNGSAQGDGVECRWDDPRDIKDLHIVTDPILESNQLIIADNTKTKRRLVVDE